ncbi:lysine N(6)-hydroxylase/L-ornithine N(5)-oxygenase family protein [Kitasatospora sp. NA04385]|uniref:SidA/IucD/PvdA family monooxygenase n=1 Tax=Kitasatospora sp. NA04385 TaxID=2742135 RepID=UPI001592889F|nr:SidA/IucD/PvdA family monooxygenase [Kitasatospora sp. NA04385]QKW23637.1 lysine N(6)-hydroxylase/L-ornithine N(5)-oxygenase family protein [Kitasatospora sp. NA04385]
MTTSPATAGLPHQRLLGIGFGPSHLSMAALHASRAAAGGAGSVHFLEARASFAWHPDMLLPGARMQVAFLKDLVTPREPTSPFSFVNFLVAHGRLEQFLDLATLNPTRHEFVEYFRWAAARLPGYASYGHRAEAIRPAVAPDGTVTHLEVDHRGPDGTRHTTTADHVSVAPGGSPVVPRGVDPAARESGAVLHNSAFLTGIQPFHRRGRELPHRFLVVGAGQSAAEAFQYLAAEFPAAAVTLAHRGFALQPANSSALANAIFAPAAVDLFHGAAPARRRGILAELRTTNYAAVDDTDIDAVAGLLYDQQVRGGQRLAVRRFTELTACRAAGPGAAATLRDLLTGEERTEEYDAVVLATGYDFTEARGLLAGLDRYLLRDEDGRLLVDRDYSVRTAPGFAPKVFLHGAAEHTHGLTSTLLSLIAHRAGDILDAVDAADGAARPAPTDHLLQGAHA